MQRTPTRHFAGTLRTVDHHQTGKDVSLAGNYNSVLPQQSIDHRARQVPHEDVSELSAEEVEDMLYRSRRHHSTQHAVQNFGQSGVRRMNLAVPVQQGKRR